MWSGGNGGGCMELVWRSFVNFLEMHEAARVWRTGRHGGRLGGGPHFLVAGGGGWGVVCFCGEASLSILLIHSHFDN